PVCTASFAIDTGSRHSPRWNVPADERFFVPAGVYCKEEMALMHAQDTDGGQVCQGYFRMCLFVGV
ncbi:MAG: hypothetical protein Q8K00_19375, partial [Syntrophales bacterium]|nr:hypothetical protein [Syntrophales bacterium]